MSRRSIIILTAILATTIIGVLVFFYLTRTTTPPAPGEESSNFFANLNPFNSNPTTPGGEVTPPTDISGSTPPTDTTPPNQNNQLKKVSSVPVAGFGIFLKERYKNTPVTAPIATPSTKPIAPPTEFASAVRYVARSTGNIYQTFADNIEERKFSATIVPEVVEAYFGNKGESVLMRYLKTDGKTIQTFFGTLPKEYLGADSSGTDEIKGSFLPDNISDVSISGDQTKAFYLFNVNNNAVGTTLDLVSGRKTQMFDSPFTEWLSSWPNNRMITLTTKPSALAPGYMYIFNLGTKGMEKVLGGINGLTTLTSPDGKLVLYNNNNLALSIYHIDTGNSDLLGVKTLPEKCVWGPVSDIIYCSVPKSLGGNLYPDQWYQGEISFSDEIWRIDVKNGNTTILVDPAATAGEEIDGIKLGLDGSGKYLFFVNKKDSFLWQLILQ